LCLMEAMKTISIAVSINTFRFSVVMYVLGQAEPTFMSRTLDLIALGLLLKRNVILRNAVAQKKAYKSLIYL